MGCLRLELESRRGVLLIYCRTWRGATPKLQYAADCEPAELAAVGRTGVEVGVAEVQDVGEGGADHTGTPIVAAAALKGQTAIVVAGVDS